MSFILDALKKSEAERQRQAGPTLMEVRVVPPRRRFPLWGVALGVLLGINFLLLLWFLLRKPDAALPAAPAATAAPIPPTAAAVASPAATTPTNSVREASPVAASSAAPTEAPAADTSDATNNGATNPADLQPAVPADSGHVEVGREPQSMPSFNDVSGSVPPLRLDLHVYSQRPSDRYALINMHKVREGDVLPEGPRVVEINKDGVVLSYQDREFILGQE